MKLSVIIPTYNEADHIAICVKHLQDGGAKDIIVADSLNSTDNISKLTIQMGCTYLKANKPGRNHQMNEGAKIAKGDVLYFVHADTLVHPDFLTDIEKSIKKGVDMGCYRYKFSEYTNPLLYINSFFTRFPMLWCRGGDQTLFIRKKVFEKLDGYCENHLIMEDYDLIKRSKEKYKFEIIRKNVIVSARKYAKNGYLRVQLANFQVMRKWMSDKASPQELQELYARLLS